ncbi:hypothetical protein VTJ04DRAFT_4528 [Mycothermus thermophilus]|uniref:uncharacterized protein n=1 Tax=Humicola insolens TaxID=85995 RepID=UPI0037445DF3
MNGRAVSSTLISTHPAPSEGKLTQTMSCPLPPPSAQVRKKREGTYQPDVLILLSCTIIPPPPPPLLVVISLAHKNLLTRERTNELRNGTGFSNLTGTVRTQHAVPCMLCLLVVSGQGPQHACVPFQGENALYTQRHSFARSLARLCRDAPPMFVHPS